MNRVAIHLDARGEIVAIASDEPVELYWAADATPGDRVYRMDPDNGIYEVGVAAVHAILGNDPVGHALDQSTLGEGYGPRLPPSRPKLTVV